MFVRVAWGKVQAGRWDEFQRVYAAFVGDVEGLQRRLLLQGQQDADEGMSLTFWDSEEHAARYTGTDVYRERMSKFEEFFQDEYWTKTFEIKVDNP